MYIKGYAQTDGHKTIGVQNVLYPVDAEIALTWALNNESARIISSLREKKNTNLFIESHIKCIQNY